MLSPATHMLGTTPGQTRPSRRLLRGGAATVELAAVVNTYFIIVLGIFEIGRGLMVVEQLNAVAMQGVRIASLKGATSGSVESAVDTAMQGQGLASSSGTSLGTVKIYDSGSLKYTTGDSSTVTFTSGDQIRVEVWVPISNITWVPGGKSLGVANTSYLVGKAVMVAE